MRALIVKPGSAHVGTHCRQCNKIIRARQSIVVDVIAEARFGTGAVRRWHTGCLRGLLAKAPVGVDELDQLKQRMVAAGDAFVA